MPHLKHITEIINEIKAIQCTNPVDNTGFHHYAAFFKADHLKWWEKVGYRFERNNS